MPSAQSGTARLLKSLAFIVALGLVCCLGLKLLGPRHHPQPEARPKTAAPQPLALAAATNRMLKAEPVAPGTLISAEEVLGKLDAWMASHPNYHAVVESAIFGGGVVGKMEVFAYTNGTAGTTVKVRADIFVPQAVKFQAQKENGKLRVFFPRSGQLIEPDNASLSGSVPGAALDHSGMAALLKLARNSFAEASADLRVVTLVVSAEVLKLSGFSGDVYLSIRTDLEGRLLGLEEQSQGLRIVTTMRYLSFDRDRGTQEAPSLAPGMVATTGKPLEQAMDEEARLTMNKPLLGTKI